MISEKANELVTTYGEACKAFAWFRPHSLRDMVRAENKLVAFIASLEFEAFRILPTRESAFPEAVYYNGNTTVCVFADGTKITARPMAGDSFDKATGVAMCIAKYVCGGRGRFHALVESGCDQTPELRGVGE